MAMTPIGAMLDGRTLRVAATTYMDEFLAPVRFTEERAGHIAGEYRSYVSRQTLLIGGVMIAILVMTLCVVFWLSRRAAARFVLPIRQLADTAVDFGREISADSQPTPMLERSDEIGELARSFNRMRFQIVEQFKQIKRNYENLWEAQQALSETEAHYRGLFENVPIGIAVRARRGRGCQPPL
jgi:nitrogen fixation/metabolism regulation signal transduction histidine kinase